MQPHPDATPARAEWILVLAGLALILLQFFMIREVTALLQGTEIVILLVTVAYFAGYSVGYGAARWLSFARIRWLALGTWVVHLTLPFSFRYLGGFLWQRTAGAALVALLFLTALALASFYSVLLPRFIDCAADSPGSLIRYYSIELAGAAAGIVCLRAAGSVSWFTPVLYQAALAGVIALLWARSPMGWITVCGVVAYALAFSSLEEHSLRFSYAATHDMKGADVLYSANTLYQKVDILRDAGGQRHLYLSGRENYGTPSLSRFNAFLSQVPARLVRPREALIIGSGSMESVKHVSAFADHVTTVELDAAVVEGSRRCLADVNQLDRIRNWTLLIDDGKQFLGGTTKRFDLIVMDVPAPSTIQLGLLHSVEFYQLARQHLTPQGVLSVSLCGTFAADEETPRCIAAALVRVFACVMPYTPSSDGRSFAFAGDVIPFTEEDLREAVTDITSAGAVIFSPTQTTGIIGDVSPITVDDLRLVMRRSWQHLTDYYLPEALER